MSKLRTRRGAQLIDFTHADGSVAPAWMVPMLDDGGGWAGWRQATPDEIAAEADLWVDGAGNVTSR